ncbi:MAG: DUF2339 domain-containing protein [Candidatus Paceibacterota bacterium]|jgi:uncharacterized membrane protein
MPVSFLLFAGIVFTFLYLKSRINNLEKRLGQEQRPSPFPASGISEAVGAGGYRNMKEALQDQTLLSPVQSEPDLPMPLPAAASIVEKPQEKNKEGLELKFGSKVFTAVGAVAIIFAIGFFLRYAFENGLISETARIFLGLLAGTALLALGELTRKKFSSYSQVVTGSGLGVLYLSLYAAFNFYHIVSQPFAFIAMAAVTVMGILLSLRYNSTTLACFAQFGGLITPLLLSTGENIPHVLFPYLVLLNMGAAYISYKKLWRMLTLESFLGTVFLYSLWFVRFYEPTQFAVAVFYSALFFFIFLAVSFIQNSGRKSGQDSFDLGLTTANPGLYFLASFTIMNQSYPDYAGLFTFLLGSFYLLLAFTAGSKERTSDLFHKFLIAIGFVLLVVAVPVQFHKSWITIGWAAEALALAYLGFKLRFAFVRMLGQCAFFLSIFRLFLFERGMLGDEIAFFNVRFLIFLSVFAALSLAAYIYWRRKAEIGEEEKVFFSILLVEAAIVIISIFSFEVETFFKEFWLPIVWSAGGLLAGWIASKLKDAPLRCIAYILFIFAFFRLLFFEGRANIAAYAPFFNGRVLAFLLSAAAMRMFLMVLKNRRDEDGSGEDEIVKPILFSAFHFLLLWVISAEALDYFNKQIYGLTVQERIAQGNYFTNIKNVSLSVIWAVYGIALSIAGIIKKSTYERFLAIFLLGIVILKVFLFDTSNLNNFYRFVSFITLGCILLLAGYLYYRFSDRISKFVQGK